MVRARRSGYAATLASRMREVCGDLSYSEIARRTNTNRETTRRYLNQGKPSAAFAARLCEAFGVSGTWLLTGRGPKFEPVGHEPVVASRRVHPGAMIERGRRLGA